jgi:sterol desaturase/sphingolipid hydroxylase (fatty acid hydroxylase superfamily)
MSYQFAILGIFVMFALMEAYKGRFLRKDTEVTDDGRVELVSSIMLFAVTQPAVLFTAAWLTGQAFPQYANALAGTSVFLQLALLFVFDDMMQYWWHRASHTFIPLYNLHRAHHNAKYMSVRIVFRNNIFYYAMMPSIWFSGVLIYLGLGWVYASYLVVKLTIIIGAHAEWKWDQALYRIPALHPIMWVVERVISTPSTHSAHHGLKKDDPATNYKGNYGNMFFFWDILFGTAKITRQYPQQYGVEGMRHADWKEQLVWPLYKTPRTPKKP